MAAREVPQRITHLGLDTSALISAGWPDRVSSSFESVAGVCRALGVEILLPELALEELRAERQRQMKKLVSEVEPRLGKLRGLSGGAVAVDTGNWRNVIQAVQESHTRNAARLIETFRIRVVAAPDRPTLVEALSASARHEPPFAQEDSGFRDSMIVLTLLAAAPEGSTLGLIAADNYFESGIPERAAKDRNVALRIFRTSEIAEGVLLQILGHQSSEAALSRYFERNASLARRVENHLPEIARFLKENLTVSDFLYGVQGTVESFHDVHAERIASAHERIDWEDPDNETGDLTATVSVKLDVTLRVSVDRRPPQMSVGQTGPSAIERLLSEPVWVSSRTEIPGYVDIGMSLEPGDGGERVKFTGAPSFQTEAQREFSQRAIQDALTGESAK